MRDSEAMSFKHKFGNFVLSVAMSLLYFRWVRDSQSGMWVFRRACLRWVRPCQTGMAFSEEIKLEAIRAPQVRFGERPIAYYERIGETKLFTWRDGFRNLWFLFEYRFRVWARDGRCES